MRPKVTTHAPFKVPRMSQIATPGDSLAKGIAALAGQTGFVSDGTALGMHRDGDFIPHDTDIDIAVVAEDGQEHLEALDMRLIRTMEWRGRPIQTAFIDDNACIVDFFYYYGDLVEDRITTVGESGVLSFEFYGVCMTPTKYGIVPMPNRIDLYLAARFGDDWRTPKEGSKGIYADIEL